MTNFTPNAEVVHGNTKHDPKFASLRGLFHRSHMNAKRRGIPWQISLEEFIAVVLCNCFWCDAPPSDIYNVAITKNGYTQRKFQSYLTKHGWIKHGGLDRIDTSSGYELRNVLPACKYCNFARNDRTVLEFQDWIYQVTNFRKTTADFRAATQ